MVPGTASRYLESCSQGATLSHTYGYATSTTTFYPLIFFSPAVKPTSSASFELP